MRLKVAFNPERSFRFYTNVKSAKVESSTFNPLKVFAPDSIVVVGPTFEFLKVEKNSLKVAISRMPPQDPLRTRASSARRERTFFSFACVVFN